MAECKVLFGKVPIGLAGALFRNGPDSRDRLARHILDGNGRVDVVRFRGGAATAASEAVKTEQWKAEEELGAPIFARAFGTARAARLKNLANTALLLHGGTLLATYEGGIPHEIDPASLETVGPHTLGGNVRGGLPLVGLGSAVCAHAHPAGGGGLAMLAAQYLPLGGTRLRLMVFGDGGWDLVEERIVEVPFFTLVHDFAVTENHFVLIAARFSFSALPFAMGLRSAAQSVTHLQGGSKLFVVPRRTVAPHRTYGVPRCFPTHFVNCWEEGAVIVADAVVCPSASLDRFPECTPRRYVVGKESVVSAQLHHNVADFPCINPVWYGLRTRFSYFVTRGSGGTCWVRLDALTSEAKRVEVVPGALHGEATFVPYGPGEAHGFLVGFMIINGRAAVGIADARTMTPLCAIDAPGCNTTGLHGIWVN